MNTFLTNPGQHPVIVLMIAILAIFLAVKILRAAFRLAVVAALIGCIMVVFFGYSPKEVLNQGEKIAANSTAYFDNSIKPAIYNGLKNAQVKKGPNGMVEIIGDQFEIGETPQGKFIFNIKPLNISLSQDELSKYLGQEEVQKILQTLKDKTNSL